MLHFVEQQVRKAGRLLLRIRVQRPGILRGGTRPFVRRSTRYLREPRHQDRPQDLDPLLQLHGGHRGRLRPGIQVRGNLVLCPVRGRSHRQERLLHLELGHVFPPARRLLPGMDGALPPNGSHHRSLPREPVHPRPRNRRRRVGKLHAGRPRSALQRHPSPCQLERKHPHLLWFGVRSLGRSAHYHLRQPPLRLPGGRSLHRHEEPHVPHPGKLCLYRDGLGWSLHHQRSGH
mmetsp:Transcript_20234/g.47391  ORF Transcript_20234/g.47391 Transcript_20234/m.47391 type:complete len:232 (-) Transcript_20234:2305-3000(-)